MQPSPSSQPSPTSQFTAITDAPGVGHIKSQIFIENTKENLEILFYKFVDILSTEVSSRDFSKELIKSRDSEKYLAESYFNQLKKPSNNFDSAYHNFDKAFQEGLSRNRFLDTLKEYVKKEIKDKFKSEVAEKSFIAGDSEAFQILLKKSPIFDFSRQNTNVQNYAREALEELSQLPENQKHLTLLNALKQNSNSQEYSTVTSSRSSQDSIMSTQKIRKILVTDNEFLKSFKEGHLIPEKEETMEKLIAIQKRLDECKSYFAISDAKSKSQSSEERSSLGQASFSSRSSSFSASRTAKNAYVGDSFNLRQLYDNAQKKMQEIKRQFPEMGLQSGAKTQSSLQAPGNPQDFKDDDMKTLARLLVDLLPPEKINVLMKELNVGEREVTSTSLFLSPVAPSPSRTHVDRLSDMREAGAKSDMGR